MISTSLARRYVRALYELATESSNQEETGKHLEEITTFISSEKEFRDVLENPSVKPEGKLKLFDEIFAQTKINTLTLNFVRLLIKKRRIDYLEVISQEYRKLENERKGQVVVEMTTARLMTKETEKEIHDKLEIMLGKKVELNTNEDPGLLGGVVARIGSTVYDGSIKHQLALLQKRLGEE